MLRIAICDDDKILVTQIEEMLNRYLDKKMIDRYIEIFYDGASLERIYAVSYTHLRAHETLANLVCRLLLE